MADDKKIVYEVEGKRLGSLTDDEWKKEKSRSLYSTLLFAGIFLFCITGGVILSFAYVNGDISKWLHATPDKEFLNIKLFESEIKQDFQVRVNSSVLLLNIDVLTDEGNDSWRNLGEFKMEFNRMTVFDGKIPEDAFVLYYPPQDWFTKVASEKAKYEEIHVPVPKQKVGVDPTFFKDKDFPYELYPYDEIEITTNKVIKIIETNETIYDFYVRVKESNKEFNIKDMRIRYAGGSQNGKNV